ncbi:hypothetical protein C0992_006393, partial [Termitomyces sp. T32_za158]
MTHLWSTLHTPNTPASSLPLEHINPLPHRPWALAITASTLSDPTLPQSPTSTLPDPVAVQLLASPTSPASSASSGNHS